ncbi:hypothetical protein GGR51DRAFT_268492 [Nemania sp. FL0031]|nr:hypothetical protein GGR51DRAFT_268492 [Nemania sp. FL0031]
MSDVVRENLVSDLEDSPRPAAMTPLITQSSEVTASNNRSSRAPSPEVSAPAEAEGDGSREGSDKKGLGTAKDHNGSPGNASAALLDDFVMMKGRLAKLEELLVGQNKLEGFESSWESAREKYGRDAERKLWNQAREGITRKIKDTKESYEFGGRFFNRFLIDIDQELNSEEMFMDKLMALRHNWERLSITGSERSVGRFSRPNPRNSRSVEEMEFQYRKARLQAELSKAKEDLRFQGEQLDAEYRMRMRIIQERTRNENHQSSSPGVADPASSPAVPTDRLSVDVSPHPSEIYARSGETYMDWENYNSGRNGAEKWSTVLDVLIGDPCNRGSVHTDRGPGVKARGEQTPILGQAPLPERIRINSTPLIEILTKIRNGSLSNEGSRPITILRPFKALVYYEDELRKWYNDLAKKYTVRVEVSVDGVAANDTLSGDSNNNIMDDGEGEEETDERFDKITGSTTALEHLHCLLRFIDENLHAKLKYLRSPNCKNIVFSDIWHLFKPGDFVIDQDGRHSRQVYRVISVISTIHKGYSDNRSPFFRLLLDPSNREEVEERISIHCVYLDFDGVSLGPATKEFKIQRFEGEKPIKSLDLCPLNQLENRELWEKLKERGRKFLDVVRVKHMYYDGYTLEAQDELDGQVMVDFEEAFLVKDHEGWRPRIGTFAPPNPSSGSCNAECCRRDYVYDDAFIEQKRNEEFMASLFPPDNGGSIPITLYPRLLSEIAQASTTDEELVIMSYRAFGFGLGSRTWAKLDLEYLHPVYDNAEAGERLKSQQATSKENRTALDELVLPRDSKHKDIVKSLIAQHFKEKEKELATGESDQPDMVRGKGKGLILLLHGAPGVGKTTTAEGTAEFFKKPLFQIGCGDLGTTAKEVETILVRYFALASKWGCILLLDEADVFLSQRDRLNLKRNGLVAVFLRILEYYAGILFLTTNRLGDFDEAFASRIHISLHYPDLDQDSTRKVFELNLERIRKRRGDKVDIWQEEITRFINEYWANHPNSHWNGRQIRNACQTALALAEFEAMSNKHNPIGNTSVTELRRAHFETVAKAYVEFMKYVEDIHGIDATQRAWEQHLRVGRISGRRNKAAVNPLLMPKNSGATSMLGATNPAYTVPIQYPKHVSRHAEVPNEQQPTYQNQTQQTSFINPPGRYGAGGTNDPSVPYSYYPPGGPAPPVYIQAPPSEQSQLPQGLPGNPVSGVAAASNPQYGGGGTVVQGVMPMDNGYVHAGIGRHVVPTGGSNSGISTNPMVSRGGPAFYGHQHQEQARFPETQGGYGPGQVQTNTMNRQDTTQPEPDQGRQMYPGAQQ